MLQTEFLFSPPHKIHAEILPPKVMVLKNGVFGKVTGS